ncbi:hypothetical protein PtoMrB4_26490 [Metapseudomonas otitidis]|uniref:Uncharacterized protein n=1 Tax=Metapseudomonas otitidis TaxID=319939 RepID=A0A679GHJ1_9GAMM|nr:hypothetical protein PtoMrB4_26490 [Pseudomonas otitidis]
MGQAGQYGQGEGGDGSEFLHEMTAPGWALSIRRAPYAGMAGALGEGARRCRRVAPGEAECVRGGQGLKKNESVYLIAKWNNLALIESELEFAWALLFRADSAGTARCR